MNARNDRIRNLAVAGVLALAAVVLTTLALPRRGSKAEAASSQTTAVVVATKDLAVGTSVSSAIGSRALQVRNVPVSAVAPDAVTALASAANQVVVQPVYAGEQLTARRLGESSAAGLRSVLAGNQRVIEIAGTPQQLLSGTLRDGDHVDVVASVKVGQQGAAAAGVVLRNIVVVNAPTTSSAATGIQTASATVALTDAQVQRLFYVLQNGDWSFVLRPAARVAATPRPPVTANSVFGAR